VNRPSLGRAARSPNASEQLGRGDSQCAGDLHDIDQAYVSFATLDPSYICPVEVRPFGQGFLRKRQCQPLMADCLAELGTGIRVHAPIFSEQRL
jgi:hypothetical protein